MTHKDTTKSCSACGTSPMNHKVVFTFNVLEETLGKLAEIMMKLSKNQRLVNYFEKVLHNTLSLVGIVRFNTDMEKAVTGRSKLIWEEAKRRSLKMEQIIIFGKPIEHYRVHINGKDFYFESLPIPPWLPQRGYAWIDDKFKLARLLQKENIPAPKSIKIRTRRSTEKAFDLLNKPLIIKPKNGSRGRHTTTNINTKEEAIKAFNLGYQITPSMVIQEHLFGSVYRATVINNKLVGFFRGDPPNVTGNGKSTILELIEEKNKNHHPLLSNIEINNELVTFIKRQDYTLESVLEKDTAINLIAKTGRMYGGYTKEMLPDVHPKIHEIFKKAGQVLEAPVIGFDLIIEDPTLDPDTQRFGIIEANSLPFIDLHYFALEGTPINLAENVWDLWKDPHPQ